MVRATQRGAWCERPLALYVDAVRLRLPRDQQGGEAVTDMRDTLRARCESARARGVETIEVPVEAIQRLVTEGDQLEHRCERLVTDCHDLIAKNDELTATCAQLEADNLDLLGEAS